jgi:hypothetical protein
MRTTIRLPDSHRDKLLKMAADRGDRSCTRLVQEAVSQYLAQQERGSEPPGLRADTRAERAWLIFGWLWEEAAGLIGAARTLRARLRGSPGAGAWVAGPSE